MPGKFPGKEEEARWSEAGRLRKGGRVYGRGSEGDSEKSA